MNTVYCICALDIKPDDIKFKIFCQLLFSILFFKSGPMFKINSFIHYIDENLEQNLQLSDIAIKYGFQSQQSFTATFRKYFNKTPRQYRIAGHRLVLLEKSRLSALDIERLYVLNQNKVSHVCKEAFLVMVYSYFGANQNNEIPLLFNRFLNDIHGMDHLNSPTAYLGLCDHVPDYDSEKSEFSYKVCIEINTPQAYCLRV